MLYAEEARILRRSLAITGLAVPMVLLVALLAAGRGGLVGAAIGVALTVVFFLTSVAAVTAAARVSPQLVLPAALATYTLKIVVLGIVFLRLADTTLFHHAAFGWTVIATTLVFVAGETLLVRRAKIPYVTLPGATK